MTLDLSTVPGLDEPLEFVGVSTVAKIINPGEGLLIWANNQGLRGRNLKAARGDGQAIGLDVHRVLEGLAAGRQLDELVERDSRAWQPAWSLAGWYLGEGVQVLRSEFSVQSEKHRFRGRVDLARRCLDESCWCAGEGARLVDVKTGAGRAFPEHHLQLALYRLAYGEMRLAPACCGAEIVGLPSSGPAWVMDEDCGPDAAVAAVTLHRTVVRLRG